jgi:hypothetical protein
VQAFFGQALDQVPNDQVREGLIELAVAWLSARG